MWLQACSCMAASSVGRGFEGRAAAQRGRRGDLGAVLFKLSGLSPVFSQNLRLQLIEYTPVSE